MDTKHVTLILVVDKSTNHVVFAESGNDFIDILLSFLSLPLGTIVKITGTNPFPLHSIGKLYETLEGLDDACFNPKACKTMLLNPPSPLADKWRSLKLHLYDKVQPRYFVCDPDCADQTLSTIRGTLCGLRGHATDMEVHMLQSPDVNDTVFVEAGSSRFTITDDMVITPSSTEGTLSILDKMGIKDRSHLEAREVKLGHSEALRLLQQSLYSNASLTSVFLINDEETLSAQPSIGARPHARTTQILSEERKALTTSVKLMLHKADQKLQFAEADQDFLCRLFSFLVYPVGAVVKLSGGQSHIRCIDNLYQSADSLSKAGFLKDGGDVLLNPKLPRCFSFMKPLIQIEEVKPKVRYYMCRTSGCISNVLSRIANVKCGCGVITNKRLTLEYPEPPPGSEGRFLRSSLYRVSNDLVALPLSSVSLACGPIGEDLELRVLAKDVGEEETLALLCAVFNSETVLTDALLCKKDNPVRKVSANVGYGEGSYM